jgi:secreted trypsin-like serine protease
MLTTILLAPLLGVLLSSFTLPIKGQFLNQVDVPGPVGPWSVKEKDTALYKGNWRLQYVEERLAKFTQSLRKGGDAIMSDTPKIVGGFQVNATSTLHRFQVALLSASSSSDWVGQFCGGTLYKGQYVITAAHCSDFINNPTDVFVLVGTNTLSTTGKGYRVPVASIAIHPMWNLSTYDYDVAVWKLAVNVTNVTSIPMLSARDVDVAAGLQATVTGWGATENSPAGTPSWPTQLRAAVVPVVSRTVCNGAASYNGAITSRMLCAGQTGIDR